MADLMRINAKYEDVIKSEEALMFHYDRKVGAGARDKLAIQCYQFVMQRETERAIKQNKDIYEYWKEQIDGKDTRN